jgi:hypothetical protein
MRGWLRRIRGVLGMGIVWGGAGALVGMAIELINGIWSTPLGAMMDMWPVAIGLPSFFMGITFSTVLGVVARSRRFDELSLAKFAILGGLGGLVVAVLPWPLVSLGLVPVGFNLWPVVPAIIVLFTLVGIIVAPGTLALARMTEDRPLGGSQARESASAIRQPAQKDEQLGEGTPISLRVHSQRSGDSEPP